MEQIQNTGHTISIEEKEVRGINVKNLIGIVSATVIICSTVLGSKFSIESKIERFEVQKAADDKYNDLKLQTLEMKISAIELQLKELNDRFTQSQPLSNK